MVNFKYFTNSTGEINQASTYFLKEPGSLSLKNYPVFILLKLFSKYFEIL